jgi:lipopolysaccharide export system protein LptA
MKTIIIILSLFLTFVYAEEVKITANSFEIDEKKRISIFKGNVHILKGNDELNASVLSVIFDKKNKPIKYRARGKVSFLLFMKNKTIYSGSSRELIYIPVKQQYKLLKNVIIHEITSSKILRGEKVIVNQINGTLKVLGVNKKPVQMTFIINANKKEK